MPSGVDLFDDLAFASPSRVFATTSTLAGACAVVSAALPGSWLESDWLSEFRGRPQWATASVGASTFAYVLGGYSDADSGNVVLATGDGAQVHADGTTGPSFSVSPLPQPTTFGASASADDWVFVIGGRAAIFSPTPRPDVVSAQASPIGTLGVWGAQASLPAPRSNMSAVVAGNYLYVLGGAAATTVDTVFAAQVRF